MNKYQEALYYLYWYCSVKDKEQRDLLQELVDKEIPKKLLKSQFDGYRECSNCEAIVVSTNYTLPKYCSNCGQKIDFGNEE